MFKRALVETILTICHWATERLMGFNVEVVRADMENLSGVIDVHSMHLWRSRHRLNAMSAHIVIEDFKHTEEIKRGLKAVLTHNYSIVQTTLEFEISDG